MSKKAKKYAIFDLNGTLAFYDVAKSARDALRILQSEDDSYKQNWPRVHELDEEECAMMDEWVANNQAMHLWPFDWKWLR